MKLIICDEILELKFGEFSMCFIIFVIYINFFVLVFDKKKIILKCRMIIEDNNIE